MGNRHYSSFPSGHLPCRGGNRHYIQLFLKQIALENFRSFTSARFRFDPAGNLIIAPNGWGKTNLLEAVAYCGLGRSVRFHRDLDLKREGATYFRLAASFQNDDAPELQLHISWQDGKKLLRWDDNPLNKLSRLYECVKVVYCAPEDVILVGGNPRFRRQYFDLAVAQLFPAYISLLRNYLHVVEQRNNLLKTTFLPQEKRSWDLRLAETLLEVVSYRSRYLRLLNGALAEQYPVVSEQVRQIQVSYLTQQHETYPQTAEGLLDLFRNWIEREKRQQRTLLGAHLDDYEFLLDGHRLRIFGSQGQKRVVVIVLKLIQAQLIEQLTGIKPILLFDDVFAELDPLHTSRIRSCIQRRYQVLVASPREEVRQDWQDLASLPLEGIQP